MDDWSAKIIVQLVGWGLVMFGVVLVIGVMVGEGGGPSYERGSDTIRALFLEGSMGRFGAGAIAVGAVALLVSLFVPDRSAP